MIESQDTKLEVMLAPGTTTLATNSSNYGYLDTLGWDYATIAYMTNKFATTSACATTLELTEGTNSTAASAIVAFTGGTSVVADSTGFTIPVYEGTSDGTIVRFNVNLTKRERYLRIKVAPGAADTPHVLATLSRGREAIPGSDDGSVAVDVTG